MKNTNVRVTTIYIFYVPFITLLRKYLKAMEIKEIRIIGITEINLKHFY